MSKITVTISALTKAANALDGLSGEYKSAIASLKSTEESLAGMWEGESQKAFRAAFAADAAQLEGFFTIIQQYRTALEDAANKYRAAETEATNLATTRTYR